MSNPAAPFPGCAHFRVTLPNLRGARGTQSSDDASNSVGPPSKCYLFTSQIIRNSGLRMQERGGETSRLRNTHQMAAGREPGPSRECHPEDGGHTSLRGARTRKAKDAAAVAKSLQSCPTLCDPIDGSPPGSPVPGILQARTLEWVAISFSNA